MTERGAPFVGCWHRSRIRVSRRGRGGELTGRPWPVAFRSHLSPDGSAVMVLACLSPSSSSLPVTTPARRSQARRGRGLRRRARQTRQGGKLRLDPQPRRAWRDQHHRRRCGRRKRDLQRHRQAYPRPADHPGQASASSCTLLWGRGTQSRPALRPQLDRRRSLSGETAVELAETVPGQGQGQGEVDRGLGPLEGPVAAGGLVADLLLDAVAGEASSEGGVAV
jgi:hypothetical protein